MKSNQDVRNLLKLEKSADCRLKYMQLANSIEAAIESGSINLKTPLPSINSITKSLNVSRSTVDRAISYLTKKGLIHSVRGKGNFLNAQNLKKEANLCLIVNELRRQETSFYEGLMLQLDKDVLIEIFVYHNAWQHFKKALTDVKGRFSYYLIVPPKDRDAAEISKLIGSELPAQKLIILERNLPELQDAGCVFKDFEEELCSVFEHLLPKLRQYRSINFIGPFEQEFPSEILHKLDLLLVNNNLNIAKMSKPAEADIHAGSLFIGLNDDDFVELVLQIKSKGLKIGEDVGIISLNEHPAKRFIEGGIFTLSVDYKRMGQIVGDMIVSGKMKQVKIPVNVNERRSI